MTVRVTGIDAAERRGGWTPDTERRLTSLESPVRSVLEPYVSSLTAADRVTLVPDAHYPFHPSSGMVTDPAVVGAVAGRLAEWTDADTDVAVAGASDDRIAFDRTVDYLDYREITERFDVDLIDLADGARRNAVVTVGDEQVSVSVPERLLESTVVVVPTLRPTEAGPIAGGVRALGRLVESVADADPTAVAAAQAVQPVLSVLDATTVYGGDPAAADALFAGPAPRVDAIGASLLERSVEADPVLREILDANDPSIAVESAADDPDSDVDLAALRRRLPAGDLPPRDDTHPAVTIAYRLYAAVAGDAVPPQLEQRP